MDAISTQTSAAAVVAVRSGDEVILVRSGNHQLGFPGGNVLSNERPGMGARRKVQEETGLDIRKQPLQQLGMVHCEGNHILYFFGVSLEDGAFDRLEETGPKGHTIVRCKLSELEGIHLKTKHRQLLIQVKKRS